MPNSDNSACICRDGQELSGTSCTACTGNQFSMGGADCQSCTGEMVPNAGKTACEACPDGMEPNADNSACECPNGEETYRVGILNICGEQLSDETGQYTSANCRAQGWMSEFVRDSANNIAELCLIQYQIIASTVSANTLGETSPLRLKVGESADACITRQHMDYENPALSNCVDVFGPGGEFPQASVLGEGRLRVVRNPGGVSNVSPALPPSSGTPTPQNGEFDTEQFGYFSIAAVGVIILMWQSGGPEELTWNWTPSAAVQHHNGESFYTYGSKFDYESGNWSGYWQAAQTQSGAGSGDWIYGTGTAWTGDVFAASMRNTTQGVESDTEFALSARRVFGVWTVESAYSADLEVQNLNQAWKNKLSVGARVVYDKWQVSPSAALSWQHDESIGNNTNFRLDLRREL